MKAPAAPASTKASAIDRPKPRPPPVTANTFPCRSNSRNRWWVWSFDPCGRGSWRCPRSPVADVLVKRPTLALLGRKQSLEACCEPGTRRRDNNPSVRNIGGALTLRTMFASKLRILPFHMAIELHHDQGLIKIVIAASHGVTFEYICFMTREPGQVKCY